MENRFLMLVIRKNPMMAYQTYSDQRIGCSLNAVCAQIIR